MLGDLLGATLGIPSNQKTAKYSAKLAAIRWFFVEGDAEFWFELAGLDYVSSIMKIKQVYHRYQYERPEIYRRIKTRLRREEKLTKLLGNDIIDIDDEIDIMKLA